MALLVSNMAERRLPISASVNGKCFPHKFGVASLHLLGATVAERLACSPPTKVNQVRSPDGLFPDFLTWGSCRTIPLVGGFSRGSPVSPAL
ncbi:hypothetical protein PR048_012046 [Dryococelus australis]|uniref:Uncharacterized protein n=1 Tax=Dryococelus australis TaxID=614101 RepID=A0ABQ9HN88_9NEOP|nr:hypothetical protein PR048_012046 [Dryococelus australis]